MNTIGTVIYLGTHVGSSMVVAQILSVTCD